MLRNSCNDTSVTARPPAPEPVAGTTRARARLHSTARRTWNSLVTSPAVAVLLAVLLGLSILLYGVSHIVRHQVMDDGFYLDALEQQSVYDRIYQEILADPALADVVDPLLGNVPVVRSFLVSILRLVLPPERIREGAELVVAEWQLYLRGERDVWQPRIDLGGIDTNIVPFISSYVATRIATATGIEVASTAEFRRELESSFASLMQGDIPNAVPKLQPRNPSEAKALAGLMLSRAPVPVLPGAQDQIAAALMVGNVQEAFADRKSVV